MLTGTGGVGGTCLCPQPANNRLLIPIAKNNILMKLNIDYCLLMKKQSLL
jgi:hypothetical protein